MCVCVSMFLSVFVSVFFLCFVGVFSVFVSVFFLCFFLYLFLLCLLLYVMLNWSVTGVMAERGNEERRIVEVIEEPGTRRDSIRYTTNDGHFFLRKSKG